MELCKTIFKPSDIDLLLNKDVKFIKNNKKLEYANIPVAFDIETTSFVNPDGEKCATMYAFVLGINGKCIIGRTWDEFLLLIDKIRTFYDLADNKRIIIWVHNLAFEFAFIQHLFKWDNVFATDKRKPVYAVSNGIEFRCSLILSGYSLEMVGKNLVKYKVEKLVGDLDYKLIRHSKTPLTEKEYGYILHDGLVVMAYVRELLEQYGDFHKLPLTKTGFARKYVRKECLYGGISSHKKGNVYKYYKHYSTLMQTLRIPNYKAYLQMKQVYQGGLTHCNSLYSGVVLSDITSYDFCSSYPSVMIAEMYPMTSPKLIHLKSFKEFEDYLSKYCCMFYATFINIEPKLTQEHIISASKCWNTIDAIEDNGRIVSASKITIALNEIDYGCIKRFYKWDNVIINDLRVMEKGYLPTPFVKAILKLYELKTILKGSTDIDDIQRLMNAKGNLNSCYGMCVTDVLQITRKYENGMWIDETPDIKDVFNKYNNSKSRFLFYPWGIWVTSYARRNLLWGIESVGKDYVYSDTDSLKIRNGEKHLPFINKYNEIVIKKLKNALDYHKLDYSMILPKNNKGEEKPLGIWEFDGFYKKFKTLGAKRYLYQDENNQMHLTCSGLQKTTINYMMNLSNNDIDECFEMFDDTMYIPDGETGKNIHTYIDYEMKGYLTDYLGNTASYEEKSGVYLEGAEYTLKLSKSYIDYLKGIEIWQR